MASRLPGFMLLEVAFTLLIIGAVGTLGLSAYRSIKNNQAHAVTEQRMDSLFKALAYYVHRNGLLPCPATSEDGFEQSSSIGCSSSVGLVPYQTLGISEREARDGWQHKIVYAVDTAFHFSDLELRMKSYKTESFCTTPSSNIIGVAQQAGAAPFVYPAVLLMSFGPSGDSKKTDVKVQNSSAQQIFVDNNTEPGSDDIVRFTTSDHLLAFYSKTGCPA